MAKRPYQGTKVHHRKDGGVTIVKELGPKERHIHHHHNHAPSGCFPGNAAVLTEAGYRPIRSIVVGDQVMTLQGNVLTRSSVLQIKTYAGKAVLDIQVESSAKQLSVTPSHTIFTKRGWVRAKDIKIFDEIQVVNSGSAQFLRVAKISTRTVAESVYNLVTSGTHTFIVEGVVVHNFTHMRMLRTLIHRWLLDPIRNREASLEPATRL